MANSQLLKRCSGPFANICWCCLCFKRHRWVERCLLLREPGLDGVS
jgi:hypothetical protein